MQDWLTARVQATPRKIALIIGEARWTYGELNHLVDTYCAGLIAQGVTPGQQVAVLLPNGLTYVCLVHALARLGAVLAPLNTRLTVAELRWQISHSDSSLLVYAEETASIASQLTGENSCVAVDAAALRWQGERTTSETAPKGLPLPKTGFSSTPPKPSSSPPARPASRRGRC